MNPSVQIPWLTLSKAADKITQMTGKPHSEADLLDAALDCRLSLSVQVPSLGIFARRGEFQAFGDDTPFGISTNVRLQYAKNGVAVTSTRSPFVPKIIEDAFFAYSTEEGDYVQGLFDLLLIGNGRAHIENLSKGYRGDCELIPLLPCGGVFLEGAQGAMGPIWEVQDEIISGEHQDPDHECEYAPADRFPPCWSVVVRTPEVARFYRGTKEYKMRATLRRSLRRQSEQDKEHFEIQKILSKHQPATVGLISPEELLGDHGINRIKALRLGVEGKLRFYIFIKYATIVFGDFLEAPEDGGEYLDPQYCFDTGKGFFFQVAPATLEEMLQSPDGKNEGHVQLIFPDALKGKTGAWKPDAPDVTYKNRIQGGFYRPYGPSGTLKVAGDKYLDGQMGRKIENLCILKEDVAAYQRELNKKNQPHNNPSPAIFQDEQNEKFVTLKSVVESTGKPYQDILCLARDNHESLPLLVRVAFCKLASSVPPRESVGKKGYFAIPWAEIEDDVIEVYRVVPAGRPLGIGEMDVNFQRQIRDALGAIPLLGEPDIYEFPRDLGNFYFFKDQADQFFSIGTTHPTTDQSTPVAGADTIKYGWTVMEGLTGLTRDKIRYRATASGYQFVKENPNNPNSKPGLMIWQLNKIANYKRSNAAT